MYLMYRLFGSVILLLVNLTIVMIIFQRFLSAMRTHYKWMAEITEFNAIVRCARDSVDYIGGEVSKGMEEIKADIGIELDVTDRLTKLSSKVADILRRFANLEETVIELVRMNHNTESVTIETPTDINKEVKRILAVANNKKEQWPRGSERRENDDENPVADAGLRNPISKFSASRGRDIIPYPLQKHNVDRPRTPALPEVQLLDDAKSENVGLRGESRRE